MAFDLASSVVIAEPEPTSEAKAPATAGPMLGVVKPAFDIASAQMIDDTEMPKAPPVPFFQKVANFAVNPIAEMARVGMDYGVESPIAKEEVKSIQGIQFLPFVDDKNKARDSAMVAQLAGVSPADVEPYYDSVKAMYHLATNPAMLGADLQERVPGKTEETILNAVMTPLVVAGIVANPVRAIPQLLGFAALDHVLNLKQYIDPKMPEDEQSKARMGIMVVEGLLVGGVEHGIKSATDLGPVFDLSKLDFKESDVVVGKYLTKTLEDHDLPAVITLHPDALETINKIDAAKKMTRKADARRQATVDLVAGRLSENASIKDVNATPDIIHDAMQQVVDELNLKEQQNGKLKNREQQVRFDLKQKLAATPDPNSIAGKLGITKATAETASANQLGVKINLGDVAKVGVSNPVEAQQVLVAIKETMPEAPKASAPAEGSAPVAEDVPAEASMGGETTSGRVAEPKKPVEGEGKVSGLAKNIEKKLVEDENMDKGASLARYENTTLEEQAKLAAEVMAKGDEHLGKVIRGEEPMLPNQRGFALITAVEDYLSKNPNDDLAYDLVNSPLVTEVSRAASELSTGQNRIQDSASARLQEVKKFRAEKAKKVTKTSPEEIKKLLKDYTQKNNLPKEELKWDKFLDEIAC